MKYLIAGLGNIGDEYANTRHNIGFVIADALAQDLKVSFSTGRLAAIATSKFKARQLLIIKPATYMNLSGKALKYWMDKEKIPLENVLVIFDDLDLDTGILRMRTKGSGGTHNGMNDIISALGRNDINRLRVGIGRDFAPGFQIEYVLGKWTKMEEKVLIEKIPAAIEMIKSFVFNGAQRTMNLFNNK
jgi:peptidyl-tRNA hydrolase, PTH1 family